MPIITSGIFLPNGLFLPNYGDGHAKNAGRFCEKYENLDRLKNESILNSDEFMITAGCGIVAAYDGNRCFKVASDNENKIINALTEMYAAAGYKIWPYWTIDKVALSVLNNVLIMMPKMEIMLKGCDAT
ncbi:MAG: hypothetical protein IJH12_01035 [Clostridia bacterium]|nr:hypothetical protein [Clostridia bacterium]